MTTSKQTPVRSVTPCLAFPARAEEAVNFYVSVFKDSRINNVVRSDGSGGLEPGRLLHASFELSGREYTALAGDPSFTFGTGFSLVATCENQAELDDVWNKLARDGGKEGPCGWVTDKFGVSWQVVPVQLGQMMSDPNRGNPGNVMAALMKMKKLDIATLEAAYHA